MPTPEPKTRPDNTVRVSRDARRDDGPDQVRERRGGGDDVRRKTSGGSSQSVRVRKDQAKLSENEWDCLVSAMKEFKKDKDGRTWETFVCWHLEEAADIHHDHSNPDHDHEAYLFLPWHRKFLLEFEDSLRKIDPNVTIPYWNSIKDQEIPDPFHAKVFGWMNVRRAVIRSKDVLPTKEEREEVMASPDYGTFEERMDGFHGRTHVYVGGTMATFRSPEDPLFFLHHAWIDKLWADWQEKKNDFTHPSPGETLKPWKVTTADVLRISELGYRYE